MRPNPQTHRLVGVRRENRKGGSVPRRRSEIGPRRFAEDVRNDLIHRGAIGAHMQSHDILAVTRDRWGLRFVAFLAPLPPDLSRDSVVDFVRELNRLAFAWLNQHTPERISLGVAMLRGAYATLSVISEGSLTE